MAATVESSFSSIWAQLRRKNSTEKSQVRRRSSSSHAQPRHHPLQTLAQPLPGERAAGLDVPLMVFD